MNSKAIHNLSYGLYVLTSRLNSEDNGCIINTAMQVSSNPHRISIAVNKENYSNFLITESEKFTLSVISQDATFDLFKRFGFQSGRNASKFIGIEDYLARDSNGIYYLTKGTNAYISVEVEKIIDLWSHTLYVGTISDMDILSDTKPATYDFYREKIKPSSAKTDMSTAKIWRCSVCGYEYTGEYLPDDFICPVCKHSAEYFELVN